MKRLISVDLTFQVLSLVLSALFLTAGFIAIHRIVIETQAMVAAEVPFYIYLIAVIFFLPMLAWAALMVILTFIVPACYFHRFPLIGRYHRLAYLYDILLYAKRYRGESHAYICISVFVFAILFYLFVILGAYNLFAFSVQVIFPLVAFMLPMPRNDSVSSLVSYAVCLFLLFSVNAICLFLLGNIYDTAELESAPLSIGMALGILPAFFTARILVKFFRKVNLVLDDRNKQDLDFVYKYKNLLKVLAFASLCFSYGYWFFCPLADAANRIFSKDPGTIMEAKIIKRDFVLEPFIEFSLSHEGRDYNKYMTTSYLNDDLHEPGKTVQVTVHQGLFGWKWIEMH